MIPMMRQINVRSVILPIILLNAVMFVAQGIIPGFTELFWLTQYSVFSQPWVLLTSMFLHGGLNHILLNMYGLFIFGPLLEARIGWKWFLSIYLLSGIIAGFGSQFFYSAALGASGAIMGMLGTLIILMPNLRLLFFFVIPMPLWVAGIIWAALDSFGTLFPTNVGNIAHLIGLGTGLLFGLYLKNKNTLRRSPPRSGSGMSITTSDMEQYMRTGRI